MERTKRNIFDKLPFDVVASDVVSSYTNLPLVEVGPKKYRLSENYTQYGLDIYNFEARPDDVYILGCGRSGTTLHSEMVWLIGNDLNYEEAAKHFIDYRVPHIEFSLMGSVENVQKKVAAQKEPTDDVIDIAKKYEELSLEGLTRRRERRFIKSHLPISLMPPHVFEIGAKVIYCARNPKDVVVSSYKVFNFFSPLNDNDTKRTLRRHFEKIKNDEEWFCPYFEHVKEGWARRNDKNFLFIFYEDTLKDKRQAIKNVANFLGKRLSNDQIDELEDHLSFDKFKKNKSVNNEQLIRVGVASKDEDFIRAGKAGGWKDFITADLEEEINEWIAKNLEGTDLMFPDV